MAASTLLLGGWADTGDLDRELAELRQRRDGLRARVQRVQDLLSERDACLAKQEQLFACLGSRTNWSARFEQLALLCGRLPQLELIGITGSPDGRLSGLARVRGGSLIDAMRFAEEVTSAVSSFHDSGVLLLPKLHDDFRFRPNLEFAFAIHPGAGASAPLWKQHDCDPCTTESMNWLDQAQ